MKVLFGFFLLTCAVVALVDEQTPAGNVPESKKTDLLISANGQTIKISTDAANRKAVANKAVRLNLKQKFVRVKTRRAQGEPAAGTTGEEPTLEEELSELSTVINHLSELRSAQPTAEGTLEINAEEVDKILDLLENYEQILTGSSGAADQGANGEPYPQDGPDGQQTAEDVAAEEQAAEEQAAEEQAAEEQAAEEQIAGEEQLPDERRRVRKQAAFIRTYHNRFVPIKRAQFVPVKRAHFVPVKRAQFVPIKRAQFAPLRYKAVGKRFVSP